MLVLFSMHDAVDIDWHVSITFTKIKQPFMDENASFSLDRRGAETAHGTAIVPTRIGFLVKVNERLIPREKRQWRTHLWPSHSRIGEIFFPFYLPSALISITRSDLSHNDNLPFRSILCSLFARWTRSHGSWAHLEVAACWQLSFSIYRHRPQQPVAFHFARRSRFPDKAKNAHIIWLDSW